MADKEERETGPVLRESGRLDTRNTIEKKRGAEELVTVKEPGLTSTFTVYGRTYHPGDTKIPRSLAAALGLVGELAIPEPDKTRLAPEPTGGPSVKEAAAQREAETPGPSSSKSERAEKSSK